MSAILYVQFFESNCNPNLEKQNTKQKNRKSTFFELYQTDMKSSF